MRKPFGRSLLITGTDTGVGKTLLAGGLAGALRRRGHRVGNMKPAESGCPETGGEIVPRDALFVKRMAGCESPLEAVCPYRFRAPLAPSVAAGREGVEIDPGRIVAAFEGIRAAHDVTLVEGVGGFLVPITRDFWVSDLAVRLGLPLLVVGRLGLGTLNHTLLTLEAAARRGLSVLGFVLNAVTPSDSIAEETNPDVLSSLTPVPFLGVLPHLPALAGTAPDPDRHGDDLIEAIERHLDVGALETALSLGS
ncbi:MAG: dethiobiotin synthase [Nitrospinota bacterium]